MSGRSDYSEPSPPSKASLLKWWKVFSKQSSSKEPRGGGAKPQQGRPAGAVAPAPYQPPGRGLRSAQDGEGKVFGVSLEQSLKFAAVAISMVAPDGKPTVYGYVPIVVAKCGMMLKESATSTEGIFRVSGSNKRINQLQEVFDSPPRYGKDLDWTPYTVHDAASVLRRYLNMMPEPVIPQDLYREFTGVLQNVQPLSESIAAYRHLISLLPPTSRYLLLYLLDFLSVFARFSAQNLMTASNLAVVFQPGLVSTRREGADDALLGFPGFPGGQVPTPSSAGGGARAAEGAGEHGRGKEVLEFLIEQQTHFVFGLEPPVKPKREGEKGQEYGSPDEGVSKGKAPQVVALGGATELGRRGSEKSVERRRLRKGTDSGNGKIKRSKTLPTSESRAGRGGDPRGKSADTSPTHSAPRSRTTTPDARSDDPSPSTSTAAHSPPRSTGVFRSKKAKRNSTDPESLPLPSPPSSVQPPPSDATMVSAGSPTAPGWLPKRSATETAPGEKAWSPWKGRPKSPT